MSHERSQQNPSQQSPSLSPSSLRGRWSTRWQNWVRVCSHEEPPHALAMVRIAFSLVFLADLFRVWQLDLVSLMWSEGRHGGLAHLSGARKALVLFEATPENAVILFGLTVAALLCFGGGFLTRLSGIVFVLLYAQMNLITPQGDRAIDTLARIVVLILCCSNSHRVWSIDAWIRRKRGQNPGHTLILSWPRYFLAAQLGLSYCMAGVSKVGNAWWPAGDFKALYYVLRHPVYSIYDLSFVGSQPFLFVTQAASITTVLWETTFFMVFIAMYFKATPNKTNWVRQWVNRIPVQAIYLSLGAVFHTALAFTLTLGVFPIAMMALYPVLLRPSQIQSILTRLGLST